MNPLLKRPSTLNMGRKTGVRLVLFCLFLQPNSLVLAHPFVLAQEDGRLVLSPNSFKNKDNALRLVTNWKYHAGDNPAWADSAFDDSNWEIVDPRLMPGKLPQSGWNGIGWFRHHLEVDKALWNRPLTLIYTQVGAAEIYLDGKRIHAFGKVGTSKATEEIDFALEGRPKISTISFSNKTEHVIAVRYSNFFALSYKWTDLPMIGFGMFPMIGFGVRILGEDIKDGYAHNALQVRKYTGYQFFFVAAPLIFTLLHLLLFLFYPRLKENLYYALFTSSYTILTFVVFEPSFTTDPEKALLFFWFFKISVLLVSVSGCRFLYALCYPKLPKPFWFLITGGAVLGVLSWFIPENYIYLFSLIALAEMLRVILVAILQKKDGAWIIGIGGVVLALTAAYQMLQSIFPDFLLQIELIYSYGVLGSLISMSVYLARSFAKTNTDLEKQSNELAQLNEELEDRVEQRTEFIRRTFGRYLTDEIVENLLESPEGLKFGGGKRKVTILMSDLRGFSSLAEDLPPEKVVSLLNTYLGTMTDVILKNEGTIDEFIGDAILVIFGAPIWKPDDTERAVACSVEMQLRMEDVNEQNRLAGLPEVEMGIGINTGEVVVGNIGSQKRTKYGVVGSHVNLAARIESYTVGGQILISERTLRETESLANITGQIEVEPKGVKEPITIYEVGGIGGKYNLLLPQQGEELTPLDEEIPIRYTVLEEKFAGRTVFSGSFVKLSAKEAEVFSEHPVPMLSNLKLQLFDTDEQGISGDLYGKVVGQPKDNHTRFYLRFTSVSSEVATFLQGFSAAEENR